MRRGVSLLELLVTLGVFGLVLGVVLSFYLPAITVSQQRERDSELFRRAVETLNKVEALVAGARVVEIRADFVLFLEIGEPSVVRGFPNWKAQATALTTLDNRLVLHRDGVEETLVTLAEGESLVFSFQPWRPATIDEDILSLVWNYVGPEDKDLDFSYSRMIVLERY